jgi:hypothetical protein
MKGWHPPCSVSGIGASSPHSVAAGEYGFQNPQTPKRSACFYFILLKKKTASSLNDIFIILQRIIKMDKVNFLETKKKITKSNSFVQVVWKIIVADIFFSLSDPVRL